MDESILSKATITGRNPNQETITFIIVYYLKAITEREG